MKTAYIRFVLLNLAHKILANSLVRVIREGGILLKNDIFLKSLGIVRNTQNKRYGKLVVE